MVLSNCSVVKSVMSGTAYYKLDQHPYRNMCGGTHHDGGVVNENVDPTPFLDDGLDDPLATGLVSDVLGDLEALSTSGVDELLGLVGIDLLLGEVDNGDLRAI
jgi:hypothetical protein